MPSTCTRFICRALIASLIVLPWQAQAGMLGTEQALPAAQSPDARARIAAIAGRDEVAGGLEALGLSREAARERVAALSDDEVAALAGRLDALPAGGIAHLLPVIVAALLVYYLLYVPSMAEKPAAKTPAKGRTKPAQ